jgi:hypothetical protein
MEAKGFRLKRQLVAALETFERGIFGITLTIDGELYRTPYDAWLDVMDRRLLSRLVAKLNKRGFLASPKYFWVVEFQTETRQPHWHLLVDAKRIPFGVVVELWSANRPRTAPKLPSKVTAENYKDLERPAFGSVYLSLPRARARSAANYACKYLIKPPKFGFPDWVLEHEGRVPRYGRSRNFYPRDESKPPTVKPVRDPKGFRAVHPEDCFCDDCKEGTVDSRIQRRRLKTIGERIEACGGRSMLTQADAVEQPNGAVKLVNRSFGRMVCVPFKVLKDHLGSGNPNERQILRDIGYDADLHKLESTYGPVVDGEEGEGW